MRLAGAGAVGRVLVDASELERDAVVEADVCVVGAGAAGIALALALRDRGVEVVLLEGGGLELEAGSQALCEAAQEGIETDPLHLNRLRVFGGTTGHWGGYCFPLEASDFEARPWVPYSGWPFSRRELDPHYEAAHRLLGLESIDYDYRRWLTAEQARDGVGLDGPVLRNYVIQVSVPAIRMGAAYRDTLQADRRVRVVLHANALEIEGNQTASEVTGVRASTLTGHRIRARAQRYVLAVGAVENARLLLASSSVQREGLGNGRDLVGRFFMQHPQIVQALWAHEVGAGADLGRTGSARHIGIATRITPEVSRRERMLDYHFLLLGEGGPHREGVLAPVLEAVDQLRAVYSERTLERAVAGFVASLSAGVSRRGAGSLSPIGERVEQAPNPDSRIRLGEQRDALGMRRVVMDWRLGELDLHTLARGRALLAQELGRLGLGRLRDWPPGYDPRSSGFLHGGHHHFGTTRMHDDPSQGVVDRNARVHGVANLYVAGGSVFPTSGFANPTLTIVALALRLAAELARSLGR